MELTISDLKPFLPGLEEALDDESVSEVMVNEPGRAFVERAGRMTALDTPALTAEAVARAAIQIARPLREDPATDPIIDARLADGSRVAVCSPPAAPTTAITIRRFGGRAFTIAELTASGSLPALVVEAAAAAHDAAMRVPDRPAPAPGPAATGGAPTMSEELKTVLRDMGAAGYRTGYEASLERLHSDPHQSGRVYFRGLYRIVPTPPGGQTVPNIVAAGGRPNPSRPDARGGFIVPSR